MVKGRCNQLQLLDLVFNFFVYWVVILDGIAWIGIHSVIVDAVNHTLIVAVDLD